MPKNPNKGKAKAEEVPKEEPKEEEEEEDSEPEPAPAKKEKGKAKAKAEAKKESSSSESDSEASDSSDSDSEPAAKKAAEPAAPKPPPGPLVVPFVPHDSVPINETPVTMRYCSICGLPPDFCQYGPSWDKCKPVTLKAFPEYYPELSGVNLDDAKAKADEATEKGKVKEKPGGKKVRESSPHVDIKVFSRGGRKAVTSVAGLSTFSVKLDDAAKEMKKKFACGCSVVKGDAGGPDSVDIQGDCEDEIVDFIVKKYSIPENKITFLERGVKKKGKK